MSFVFLRRLTFCHSIAYGVIAGIVSFMILNGFALAVTKLSKGRVTPHEYDLSEKWVIPPGGIFPPWL